MGSRTPFQNDVTKLIFYVYFCPFLNRATRDQVESLKQIQDSRPTEPCPYYIEPQQPKPDYKDSNPVVVPENEIYTRKPLIPLGRFYPTYLIWVDDTTDILTIFDKTVLKCEQKVDRGIYNRQAKFLFVANQKVDLSKILGNSRYLTQHRYVAVVQSLPFGIDQKFKVYGYDLTANNKDQMIVLNHLWSTSKQFTALGDIFTPMTNFKGKTVFR